MSIKTLQPLFNANGIAVVGGSDHPGTVGWTVIDNLVAGGFDKPIYAVNLRKIAHPDANWVGTVEQLPPNIDLSVICTPAETVPGLVRQLGRQGTKVVLVMTGGITTETGLRAKTLAAMRSTGVRLFGPNSVGLHLPHAHLNASFGRGQAPPGDLAVIAQSGAIATGLLDWASRNGVGFSGLVSCGDALDVDMPDLIDLFAADDRTRAILLHLEGVKDARRFLSAARAASRLKPVIALKAGRSEAAAKAALTHTGALAGSFDIHAAAFRRAGIVMVDTLTELFSAAEMLEMPQPLDGERLAIVTNGGGAAILALDALSQSEGVAASLHADTVRHLDTALPCGWSRANPVDILGDADADRYRAAIEAVESDSGVDALLVMNCPIGMTDGTELSAKASHALAASRKPAFACWLGGSNFEKAGDAFADVHVPLFDTPEDAVRSFAHLVAARRAKASRRTAAAEPQPTNRAGAQAIIDTVRREGRTTLSEPEAQQLLAAYDIPTVPSRVVESAAEIAAACAALDPPYVVKIVSPQAVHKSDIGGVALGLETAGQAQAAATSMATRIASQHPDVRIAGFVVETMVQRPHSHELAVGIADDPTFGPVLMAGAGGKAIEILRDRAFGLPPLDSGFAREMIEATRIAKLLRGYRDEPPAAIDAVVRVLCALSAIATDLPDILELDINPLLIDPSGAVALDARIRIAEQHVAQERLAICPPPSDWSADLMTRSGDTIHLRPATPTDADLVAALFRAVDPQDLRFRLGSARALSPTQISEMLDVDFSRAATFLAIDLHGTAVAAARIESDPDGDEATVSVSVRRDRKGRGISWTLMDYVVRYARAKGIRAIEAVQNVDDVRAVQLEREMGFAITDAPPEEDLRLTKVIE